MHDLATDLSANIKATTVEGMAKTQSLAEEPMVARAILTRDRTAAEHLANDLLRRSLELDVVAIFDGQGGLLAVNTVDHAGAPIPRERVDRLYHTDFSGRGVVQGCLRDATVRPRIEFQTRCDFTPALFDSSGLSVAMSVPVNGGDGSRVGVVSTRLRFERITEFVRDTAYVRAGNAVYLVSDEGRFFDERINGGTEPQPIPEAQVVAAIGSETSVEDEVLIRSGDVALLGLRVHVGDVIEGGGINVLLCASNAWLTSEARRERLFIGAILMISFVTTSILVLYSTARADRLHAKVELNAERARMSLILENVGEGVLGLDANERVSFANATAAKLLGCPAASLTGKSLDEIVPASGGAGQPREWKREDTAVVRSDGSAFHASVMHTPLPDGTGGVVTLSDLTDRMATEQELLHATRLAGKAEVATSVLHNIGNVLNSINVSAAVVVERLRVSEIGNLVTAGEMLSEHREHLAEFMTDDERGRHLPEYLIEVAKCLGEEQQQLLSELNGVMTGVEHVRHVVSMQQAHAKSTHVIEEVLPTELMDSAVRMQQELLSRHEVTIERCYEALSSRALDKHRVLQILLNVIRNAKQAMTNVPMSERRMRLRVSEESTDEGERVVFEIRDNGVGIAPEHLTGIFAHGFTTRRDGHGFGLHSSANAAKEMGGSLDAYSEGPGRGATFVLRVPIVAAPTDAAGKERACTAS